MPPKAGRGRKKAAKQGTLNQFVKSNHDELATENDKKVSNNEITDIDVSESNTNSIDVTKNESIKSAENSNEQESSQMNGIKDSLVVNDSIEENSNNDDKVEASLVKNENTTISGEKASEETLPNKSGKKRENVSSADNNDNKEVKSKVPIKRGRKNKTEYSDTTNENKETVNDAPEENSKEVKSEVPIKRGSRKNNTVNTKTTNENIETADEAPEENTEQNKRTRAGKNKQNKAYVVKVATSKASLKHKYAFDDPEEKVRKNAKTAILTCLEVCLNRDKELDKRSLNEAENIESAKGGSKPTAKRSTGSEDTSNQESGKKPAKIPKKSTSKGQSKKDEMPDVTCLEFENTSKSPTSKSWNMKISSWNVNGVRAWIEKDGLAYLHHESPDIFCIQETKCSDNKFPKEQLDIDGYKSYVLAAEKDGYSGVALFTKEEPISIKYGIGNKAHDCEGRVITAEYEKFFLVCAYVPNAGRGLVRLHYRMQFDKDFRSYLMSLDEKKPIVLCGDLNVAHKEIDLANPKSNKKNAGFTMEEREGFSTLLSEGKFIDTFRHLYPDQEAYTFWSYMMNARAKNIGWRLDYFIMSKRFTDHLCDHVIRNDVYGSDHCPITLFLAL